MAGEYRDARGEYVWRTIGGHRIKIYTGQSLSEAMQESGKFKQKGKKSENATDNSISYSEDDNFLSAGVKAKKDYWKKYNDAKLHNKEFDYDSELDKVKKYLSDDGINYLENMKQDDLTGNRAGAYFRQPGEAVKEAIKEAGYEKETDKEKRLKNVYMMDRVLRGMNNEEALDDGWLMAGVEDEATDEGFKVFKENNYDWDVYTNDEDYNRITKMYKDRVKDYAKDGVIARDFYDADRKAGRNNWKELAGLDDEELAFLAKDVPEFQVIGAKGTTTYKANKDLGKLSLDDKGLSKLNVAGGKKYSFEDDPEFVQSVTSDLYGRPLLSVDDKDKDYAQKLYDDEQKENKRLEGILNQSKGSKIDKISKLEKGMPYSLDMGNGIKKTAIYMGKDEDGNNAFYDGEGVSGTFAFSDNFMKDRIKISNDIDDDKFMEEYNSVMSPKKAPKASDKLSKIKEAKDKAKADYIGANRDWEKLYDKQKWNDPDSDQWHKDLDALKEKAGNSREEYKKQLTDYMKYASDEDLTWQDKVGMNNILMEDELNEYTRKNDPFGRNANNEAIHDGYYEIYRNNERRNAKLKESAKPDEPYEYVEAYAGYKDKVSKHGDRDKWSGKEYTNDEFMEHLTDANWHHERRMLESAELTNQELEYVKDHTTLGQWSADLDSEKTQKLIDEAKNKFRNKGTRKKASTGRRDFDYTKSYTPEEISKLDDDTLGKLKNSYNALYEEYSHKEKPRDLRTRNGKLENTFNKASASKYKVLNESVDREISYRGFEYDYPNATLRKKAPKGYADERLENANLQDRYAGTIKYLQQETDMDLDEILDLIKKRGKKSRK